MEFLKELENLAGHKRLENLVDIIFTVQRSLHKTVQKTDRELWSSVGPSWAYARIPLLATYCYQIRLATKIAYDKLN